ncbi:hypothetical protein BDA99DRAFT_340140 [Phascolomyces articulosus]|uniref:Uncharacterized protein n=1 Tax=Phascolomyces articulosus TaxID=60185 RepID=A0AAD5PGD5_9FUNG|nr:hypothetical protein BDA99DRAFT_340140 [Phascolomyces articulosus]
MYKHYNVSTSLVLSEEDTRAEAQRNDKNASFFSFSSFHPCIFFCSFLYIKFTSWSKRSFTIGFLICLESNIGDGVFIVIILYELLIILIRII